MDKLILNNQRSIGFVSSQPRSIEAPLAEMKTVVRWAQRGGGDEGNVGRVISGYTGPLRPERRAGWVFGVDVGGGGWFCIMGSIFTSRPSHHKYKSLKHFLWIAYLETNELKGCKRT